MCRACVTWTFLGVFSIPSLDCECIMLLLTIIVTLLWLQLVLDCRIAMWNQPSKTYGFWNTDRANAKYHTNLDPAIQRLSGRHHPYEDWQSSWQLICFSALACRIVSQHTKCRQQCRFCSTGVFKTCFPWLSDRCCQRCTDLQSLINCLEHREFNTVCKLVLYCFSYWQTSES